MSNQLLPCPFCGSAGKLEDHRTIWAVRCVSCDACMLGERAPEPEDDNQPEGYWERFEQTAIDAWNRRATQPAAGEPVAVLYKDGTVLTKGECQDEEVFRICCKVETPLYAAPPAAAHGNGLSFRTVDELAEAIRQVSAYEDLGPELIAEEMFKQAGSAEAAHGDEGVREDAERWRYGAEHGFPDAMRQIHPVEGPVYWVRDWQQGGEQFETAEAAIDAARRAQGDARD